VDCVMNPMRSRISNLKGIPMSGDPINGLLLLVVAVGLGWVLPIYLGVATANRKGYSPAWKFFGIYPITGWAAYVVLCCLTPRVQCRSCTGFIGAHFKICPYCRRDVVSDPLPVRLP
jgi:hypothetical protein